MICPNCGSNVENGAKFCASCGAAMPQSEPQPKFCQRCGQPLDGNPAFCPSCGAPTAGQQFRNAGNNIGNYFPSSQGGVVPTRSIGLYLILSLVTCGLFCIYWMIVVVNDLNAAADTPTDTNGVVVYLLSLVTCGIYGIYWMYKAGDKVSVIKRKLGEPDSGNNGIVYLILQLLGLGLINYCLIQNELNKFSASQK